MKDNPLGSIIKVDKKIAVSHDNRAEKWQEGLYVIEEDDGLPDSHLSSEAKLPWFFYGLILLVMATFFYRIYEIQFATADKYKELSYGNYTRVFYERAVRGIIYDRAGQVLVQNIPRNDLAIVPADFPREKTRRVELIGSLAALLSVDESHIKDQLNEFAYVFHPVVIKENIDHDTLLALKSKYDGKDGIIVLENFYRHYPWKDDLSHVLGYLGKITESELNQYRDIYSKQSYIGKTGIELGIEGRLKGQDRERRLIVDARGVLTSDKSDKSVIAGSDIGLTIDAELQRFVTGRLRAGLRNAGSKAGVAIVLDPNNGEILSLVSLPTYDNNLFAGGITGTEAMRQYQDLIQDPNKPLLNRAIAGLYPPGSVFKLVSATGALAENVIGSRDRIDSPGKIILEHGFDENVEFVFPDWKASGHGKINIIDALAESSDTYFYQVIGGYEGLVGLGIERLEGYAKKFGVGIRLGIEIPGENPGVFPGNEWKLQRLGERWYQGDTYHVAIGQGYLLINPLQVASFTAVVANGGKLYKPHLVKSIVTPAGEREDMGSSLISDDIATEWVFKIVRDGMRAAITSNTGTAKGMRELNVKAAGKTGTAQYSNNEKEHAWFTAFAPYNNPEIVVTVLVEGGGEGSDAALPVVRDIIAHYFAKG